MNPVFLFGWLIGCDSNTTKSSATGTDTSGPIVTRLVGVSILTSYEGTPMNDESDLLIEKTIDPESSTMTEVVYGEEENYTLTYDISGSSFTGSIVSELSTMEINGAFLAGDQWEWTSWESTSTYTEVTDCDPFFCPEVGDHIISTDQMQDDVLMVSKAYYGVDDPETTFTIEEVLNVVDQSTFQEALNSL